MTTPASITIPYGLCHCGCGQKAPLRNNTWLSRGYKRGDPCQYISGHFRRSGYSRQRTCFRKRLCLTCGNEYTSASYGQKYCSKVCWNSDYRQKHPSTKVWGTPEYYERKELERRGFKKCKQCEGVFSLESFWKRRHLRDVRCKDCAVDFQRKNRKPDTNKERQRRYAKKWRESHPDLCRQAHKRKKENNPESFREMNRKRRVRKMKGGAYKVTTKDLSRLLFRQRGLCYLCSLPLIGNMHLDHVFPLKLGGRHSIGNLAWTHPRCNSAKSFKTLMRYRRECRVDAQLAGDINFRG